jgi:uncharacterized phage protein (TIGR02220 family)
VAESRIKDENFYQIQGFMINRLGLKGVPLSVYAIIYGFSQDGENEYTGSLQYLCDFCGGVSKPTIISALKSLVEKEYLIRREEIINGVQFNRYKANLPLLKNLYYPDKEILTGAVKNFNGGGKEILPNNKSNNISNDNKEIYTNVIARLNEKAGTNYRATGKATQGHINARIAEGYTIEDFYTVIDKKCAEWKGGKMEQYLRPETLFGTKFENYLNAPALPSVQYGANGIKINTAAPDDLDGIF